jgi:hypothetical protein
VVEVDNLDASLELFKVIFRNGKCDSFIYKPKGLFMHFFIMPYVSNFLRKRNRSNGHYFFLLLAVMIRVYQIKT